MLSRNTGGLWKSLVSSCGRKTSSWSWVPTEVCLNDILSYRKVTKTNTSYSNAPRHRVSFPVQGERAEGVDAGISQSPSSLYDPLKKV